MIKTIKKNVNLINNVYKVSGERILTYLMTLTVFYLPFCIITMFNTIEGKYSKLELFFIDCVSIIYILSVPLITLIFILIDKHKYTSSI